MGLLLSQSLGGCKIEQHNDLLVFYSLINLLSGGFRIFTNKFLKWVTYCTT